MAKLDAKKLELSDGTTVTIRLTWGAARRFREATGVDLANMSEWTQADQEKVSEALPKLIHAMLSKSDRAQYAAEDLEDSIDLLDAPRVIGELFSGLVTADEAKKAEEQAGQKNGPFVNGHAADGAVEESNTFTQ